MAKDVLLKQRDGNLIRIIRGILNDHRDAIGVQDPMKGNSVMITIVEGLK